MEIPSHIRDVVGAFSKDLSSEDEMGAVVRAHIWLENMVVQFVECFLPDPSHLKSLSLDYDSYVGLALACGLNKDFGPVLRAMGSLRNRFAHRLNTKLDLSTVNNLYKLLTPEQKQQVQTSFEQLRSESEPLKKVARFSNLPIGDQFRLVAISLWTILYAEVLQAKRDDFSAQQSEGHHHELPLPGR